MLDKEYVLWVWRPNASWLNKGYTISFRSPSQWVYCQLIRRRLSSSWRFRWSVWPPFLLHARRCSFYRMKTRLVWGYRFTYLLRAEIPWAISPQYVLLCMSSNSMSDSFLSNSFLSPQGRRCLVRLACLLPMTGILTLPLNLRLTTQSTPLGFLQDVWNTLH